MGTSHLCAKEILHKDAHDKFGNKLIWISLKEEEGEFLRNYCKKSAGILIFTGHFNLYINIFSKSFHGN